MERAVPKPFTFDQISWGENPGLRDLAMWSRNRQIVKALISMGNPTKILEKNDYATNIPIEYDMGGIPVQFLPHWGFYKIGTHNFDLPDKTTLLPHELIEIITDDIEHLRQRAERINPKP